MSGACCCTPQHEGGPGSSKFWGAIGWGLRENLNKAPGAVAGAGAAGAALAGAVTRVEEQAR